MANHPGDSARRAALVNRFRSQVPPRPPTEGPPRPARRLTVFGVGVDWVQITWSALGPGSVTFSTGGRTCAVDTDGGPGAAVLSGLPAETSLSIALHGPGVVGNVAPLVARTLRRPAGALLHRIATISDVHLGSPATGYFHTMVEKPPPDDPHPHRCARAALSEAERWGADEIVIKGDLVDASTDDHWAQARVLLGETALPVSILPGNHEVSSRAEVDADVALHAMGHSLVRGVETFDRPGVRVVLADTTRPHHDLGHVEPIADDLVAAVEGSTGAVLVATHHQPMTLPFPTYLPPGIPSPQARRVIRRLGRVNPRTLVTSGHTHRHRRRTLGPVTITEVGSTKDFPGTWAGYEIYEDGVVQMVRRIAEPSCIRWTDWTRRAAAGVWQLWSPGRIDDRCFSLCWES